MTLTLVEALIQQHERPRKHVLGIIPVIIFVIIYNSWMFYIGVNYGHWVYGIFEKLSWPLRILFGIGGVAVIVIIYLLGHFIHKWRWVQPPRWPCRKSEEPSELLVGVAGRRRDIVE